MFHRTTNTGINNLSQNGVMPQDAPQSGEQHSFPYQAKVIEQSAVERYARSEATRMTASTAPVANQSQPLTGNQFYVYESQNNYEEEKDTAAMNPAEDNKADNKADASAPNSRIDIPGGVFSRPGQPPIAGRAPGAYPGAYPGASTFGQPAASTANDAASGRKLYIGQGITLSGEIEACDHLVVEGVVEAALKGASVLEIAESGAFFGTVDIDEATIAGRFEGDLTVRGRLTIKASGSITGAVTYKELAVEAGAAVDGKVTPLDAKNVSSSGRKVESKPQQRKASDFGAELPFEGKAVAAE